MTDEKKKESNSLKFIWREYLQINQNKWMFFYSIIYLVVILLILANYLNFIEKREGVILSDPILKLFSPIDLTWITFSIIYLSLVAAIIYFIHFPLLLQKTILTYAVLVTFRIIAMYLLPLNPPATMIALDDPFVQLFGTGNVLTKDLFFSGHTSILFMLYLSIENRALKNLFLAATISVGICVILQHVHYSIDVFAAPFFAFASFKIAGSKVSLKM